MKNFNPEKYNKESFADKQLKKLLEEKIKESGIENGHYKKQLDTIYPPEEI